MSAVAIGIALVFFVVAQIFIHKAIGTHQAIIREVNSRMEGDAPKFSHIGFKTNSEVFTVLSLHRLFFPESLQRKRMWTFVAVYFGALVAVVLVVVVDSWVNPWT